MATTRKRKGERPDGLIQVSLEIGRDNADIYSSRQGKTAGIGSRHVELFQHATSPKMSLKNGRGGKMVVVAHSIAVKIPYKSRDFIRFDVY